jgi:hypothetical protein
MGISQVPTPSAASKTRYVETLTSGSSWTVPADVNYVNVTLIGGGGGAGKADNTAAANMQSGVGMPGTTIESYVATTPAASISYGIGAGGTSQGAGGTTTFTGATSATGGLAGVTTDTNQTGPAARSSRVNNGGGSGYSAGAAGNGGAGGAGWIVIEYWK